MKLVVVVRGGIVREVFATSYEADVEVIDLDVPDFVTDDEQAEFDALEEQVEDLRKSTDWVSVW
ncbi:hypothetical protein [Flavonifractor plautii]|uniref:hypothetical protein n=1 Tax=Flavonifractor plautii TaxID=292800 RepID=UPI003567288B